MLCVPVPLTVQRDKEADLLVLNPLPNTVSSASLDSRYQCRVIDNAVEYLARWAGRWGAGLRLRAMLRDWALSGAHGSFSARCGRWFLCDRGMRYCREEEEEEERDTSSKQVESLWAALVTKVPWGTRRSGRNDNSAVPRVKRNVGDTPLNQ